MTGVLGIDHVNMRVSPAMLEEMRVFYIDAIGLREGPRPNFNSHGYWLYAGEQPVIHLSTSRTPTDDAPQPTGRFDHYAFACTDVTAARERLDRAGVNYRVDAVPEQNQIQIFLLDPSGIGIELNFAEENQHH